MKKKLKSIWAKIKDIPLIIDYNSHFLLPTSYIR